MIRILIKRTCAAVLIILALWKIVDESLIYAYVGGNPISRIDPSGTNPFLVDGVGIGLVGGVVVFSVTPGSFSERLAAAVYFEISFASTVTLAIALPENLPVQLAAIVLGTGIDAAPYSKSVADIIRPQNLPAACPPNR